MFANLKNKIREETGGDLPQLGPKHHGHGRLSRGSKGGSTSSMCSEQDTSALKPKVDWQLKADTLVCEKAVLEEEKSELVKKNLELAEQLKDALGYKQKAIQYQEDLDQLEGFQSQEIAKVKHLLLEREQQLTENKASLTKAQTEISRLRSIQDQLAHLQDSLDAANHSAEQTKQRLTQQLEESEAERLVLSEKVANISALLEASARGEVASALEQAKDSAERRLEEARLELADVKAKWCQQVTALETQVARLSVQAGEEAVERRAAEDRAREAENRMVTLTLERDTALDRAAKEANSSEEESALRDQISSLEAANKKLEDKCSRLESESSENERVKQLQTQSVAVAEEKHKTLEVKIAALEAQLKERNVNNEDYAANLSKLKEENQKLKNDLNQKSTQSEEKLSQLEQKASQYELKESQLLQKLSLSEQRAAELEQKSSLLEQKVSLSEQKSSQLEQRVALSEEKAFQFEQKSSLLEQKTFQSDQKISQLEQKISLLEQALKKSEATTKEKELEIGKISKDSQAIAEKCKKVDQLESENKALKLCCEHVDKVEAENKSLIERCTQLESNQRNLDLEETLQNTISRLEGECSLLSEKSKALEEKIGRAEKDLVEAKSEQDQLLLRNASLSQQSELNCKDLQEEIKELKSSLAKQAPKTQVDELIAKVTGLEEQLAEKNKNVKVLTQRLSDMKKTLQKEMKGADSTSSQPPIPSVKEESISEVNHAYLKHVVLKFFTSREYEAQQLTKAVATVLNFTPEEESLLKETLDWKMSWFGSKPSLKQGQTANNIHPS